MRTRFRSISHVRSAGKKLIRRMAGTRTPPLCYRSTPTKREGTKLSRWGRSKARLVELIRETTDAVDAVATVSVSVGVLGLRL